jgi:hypothetical protein
VSHFQIPLLTIVVVRYQQPVTDTSNAVSVDFELTGTTDPNLYLHALPVTGCVRRYFYFWFCDIQTHIFEITPPSSLVPSRLSSFLFRSPFSIPLFYSLFPLPSAPLYPPPPPATVHCTAQYHAPFSGGCYRFTLPTSFRNLCSFQEVGCAFWGLLLRLYFLPLFLFVSWLFESSVRGSDLLTLDGLCSR